MDRGSYIAGNGMIVQQQRLDVIANNLANVNSRGFKADRLTFGETMRRTLADRAGYGDPVASLTAGPEAKGDPSTDLSEGASERTGNPLDVRLSGKSTAMLAVAHGTETRYTRNGALKLAGLRGDLVTQAGDPVLDDAGKPITGLTGQVEIAEDGGVLQDGKTVARLGLAVGSFRKDDDGGLLFRGKDVHAPRPNDGVRVASRELETSNVNAIGSMTEMISLQRSYEIAQKMVQSQDESTAKLAETMG